MFNKRRQSKKTAPTGPASSKSRLRFAASVVTAVTIILFGATLVSANSLATKGADSQQMSREIQDLTTQNAELSAHLADLTSVSRIYKDALSAGYVTPTKVEYVGKEANPVAFRR